MSFRNHTITRKRRTRYESNRHRHRQGHRGDHRGGLRPAGQARRQRAGHQPDRHAGVLYHDHDGGSHRLHGLLRRPGRRAGALRQGAGAVHPHPAGGYLQRHAQDLTGESTPAHRLN